MAMTGPGLASSIQTQLEALFGNPVNSAVLTDFCTALVQYIQSNAQVVAGIPVATTGSSTAQTGATTGPGTIT